MSNSVCQFYTLIELGQQSCYEEKKSLKTNTAFVNKKTTYMNESTA